MRLFGTIAFALLWVNAAVAATPPQDASWDHWAQARSEESKDPVVQNREITREGRVQLIGPLFGLSDRQDFHTTFSLGVAGRYHLTELHGLQLSFDLSYPKPNGLVREIEGQTGYHPDVQLSRVQVGGAYVLTPIYGKYAWSAHSLVYFDVYATLGGGIRFSNDLQPYGEIGLGMNHYAFGEILGRRLALVPQMRWRFYPEQRTSKVFVAEGLLQLGVSCLF